MSKRTSNIMQKSAHQIHRSQSMSQPYGGSKSGTPTTLGLLGKQREEPQLEAMLRGGQSPLVAANNLDANNELNGTDGQLRFGEIEE